MLHVLPIAVAVTSVALPLSAATHQKDAVDSLREYETVSRFLRAVDEYVVAHRLVGSLEPDNLCLPDEAYASVRSLAAVPSISVRRRKRATSSLLTSLICSDCSDTKSPGRFAILTTICRISWLR